MNSLGEMYHLWAWLYKCAAHERDEATARVLRGLREADFEQKYLKGRHGVTGISILWVLRMIGVYHSQYPDRPIPDCYPVGHKFERIDDIRTANFNRKESAMNHAPMPCAPSAPRVPGMLPSHAAPYGQQPTPEETLKRGQELIAQAESEIAERTRRDELRARIDYELSLANATARLLADVQSIALGGGRADQSAYLVQFRKELAPLADSYGFSIVLVGDKSVAVLTQ